jgi:nucleotidyltransferase/DNA polymerase involved in DNA repair
MECCLSTQLNGRVVIHVDMDCFYAQVEHRRLKIPNSQPLAVQQWDGLIAVNYAARAKGVTRHMRVQACPFMPIHHRMRDDCLGPPLAQDAKKACPELVLVHVEVISSAGTEASACTNAADPTLAADTIPATEPNAGHATKASDKVCARAPARTHTHTHVPEHIRVDASA